MNLLLVDDDPVEVEALRRAFKKAGTLNSIFSAGNGEEALMLLRSGAVPEPRIILLDLHMPRMGGLEFLGELRRDPDLKSEIVFVLTTSAAQEDISAAYGYHVAGYLLKDEAGEGLCGLANWLEQYWITVEIPVRR